MVVGAEPFTISTVFVVTVLVATLFFAPDGDAETFETLVVVVLLIGDSFLGAATAEVGRELKVDVDTTRLAAVVDDAVDKVDLVTVVLVVVVVLASGL